MQTILHGIQGCPFDPQLHAHSIPDGHNEDANDALSRIKASEAAAASTTECCDVEGTLAGNFLPFPLTFSILVMVHSSALAALDQQIMNWYVNATRSICTYLVANKFLNF